jgi:hypothetical protein
LSDIPFMNAKSKRTRASLQLLKDPAPLRPFSQRLL